MQFTWIDSDVGKLLISLFEINYMLHVLLFDFNIGQPLSVVSVIFKTMEKTTPWYQRFSYKKFVKNW